MASGRRFTMHPVDLRQDASCGTPQELEPWLGELSARRELVSSLLLPVIELPVAELVWQLDLPLWPNAHGDPFRVRPLDVVDGPQLRDTDAADLALPVDVVWRGDRWLVLDGLHRVLKAARTGRQTLAARPVPHETLFRLAA
jgi:hypothetical protein